MESYENMERRSYEKNSNWDRKKNQRKFTKKKTLNLAVFANLLFNKYG